MAYRQISIAVSLLIMAGVSASRDARAATVDHFQVRTTADYVALCTTSPDDQIYEAAVAFCHGFAVGAYQYYLAMAEASPEDRYVCLPNPPPTRVAALADFVAWINGNPQYLQDKPVDSVFRYLKSRYPCGQ